MLKQISTSLKDINLYKLFYALATLFFLCSLFFAIYYFKERCLYIDSAFQFFKIINSESFNIEAYRYGVFFTQLLPIIALKIGLPLKYILITFSISFILIDYLVFLFCYHILKEKTVSFLIPASLIIGISHGYFYTVTEIYQALVFIILFYAWINTRFKAKKKNQKQGMDVLIAFIFFLQAFFCHPLASFPILFIITYQGLYYKLKFKNGLFLLFPLILLVSILKIITTESTGYEGNLFKDFINSPGILFDLLSLYPAKLFFKNIFFDIYLIPSLLFLVLIYNYLIKKRHLLLGLIGFSVLGYWSVLSLTFHQGDDDIAMEKTFASLFILILIPFSNEIIFNNQKFKFTKALFFLAIIITGFVFIQQSGKIYSRRITYLESLLNAPNTQTGNKYIMAKPDLDEIIRIPWALSVESLLLSALQKTGEQKTIYAETEQNETENIDLSLANQFLMTPFSLQWKLPFNKTYFELKPGSYKRLQKEDYLRTRKFIPLKEFDSEKWDNAVLIADSAGKEINSFFISKNDEFSLSYESKMQQITLDKNPVFLIQVTALSKDLIDHDQLFMVLSLEKDKELIYYKRFDIATALIPNKWTSINKIVDLNFVEPESVVKVYLWNPDQLDFFVKEMKISRSNEEIIL